MRRIAATLSAVVLLSCGRTAPPVTPTVRPALSAAVSVPHPTTSVPRTTTTGGSGFEAPTETSAAPAPTSSSLLAGDVLPQPVEAAPAGVATPPAPAAAPASSLVASAPAGVAVYAAVTDPDPTWSFGPVTAFGSPTVLLVTRDLGDWLEVVVPVRENNVRGFVHATDVGTSVVTRALVVDTEAMTLSFYDSGARTDLFNVAVGAEASPTPKGLFFITDLIGTGMPHGAYGPYVIATSGRSEVYDFFNGGEPLLGIHGTNRPDLLGTAASHGCVRVDNSVISALVTQVPLGTPVLVL